MTQVLVCHVNAKDFEYGARVEWTKFMLLSLKALALIHVIAQFALHSCNCIIQIFLCVDP